MWPPFPELSHCKSTWQGTGNTIWKKTANPIVVWSNLGTDIVRSRSARQGMLSLPLYARSLWTAWRAWAEAPAWFAAAAISSGRYSEQSLMSVHRTFGRRPSVFRERSKIQRQHRLQPGLLVTCEASHGLFPETEIDGSISVSGK